MQDDDEFDSFFNNSNFDFKHSSSEEENEPEENRMHLVLFSSTVALGQQLGGFLRIEAPRGIKEGKIIMRIRSTIIEHRAINTQSSSGYKHPDMLEALRNLGNNKSVDLRRSDSACSKAKTDTMNFFSIEDQVLKKQSAYRKLSMVILLNNVKNRFLGINFKGRTEIKSSPYKYPDSCLSKVLESTKVELAREAYCSSTELSTSNAEKGLESGFKGSYKKTITLQTDDQSPLVSHLPASEKIVFDKEFEIFCNDSFTEKPISLILPFLIDLGKEIPCSGTAKISSLNLQNNSTDAKTSGFTAEIRKTNWSKMFQSLASDVRVTNSISCYFLPIGTQKPDDEEELRYVSGYIGTEVKFTVCAHTEAFRILESRHDCVIEPKPMNILNKMNCLFLRTLAKCTLRLNQTVFNRTDKVLKGSIAYKRILNNHYSYLDYIIVGRVISRTRGDFAMLSVSSESHSYFPIFNSSITLPIEVDKNQKKSKTDTIEIPLEVKLNNIVTHLDTIKTEVLDIEYFFEIYFSKEPYNYTKQIASVPIQFLPFPKELYSMTAQKRSSYFASLSSVTGSGSKGITLPFTHIELGDGDGTSENGTSLD